MAPLKVRCRSGRSRAPPVNSSAGCRGARASPWVAGALSSQGELYCQGQPVEPDADLGDGRGVVVGHLEVGLGGPRPLDEKPDRLVLRESLKIGQPPRIWYR